MSVTRGIQVPILLGAVHRPLPLLQEGNTKSFWVLEAKTLVRASSIISTTILTMREFAPLGTMMSFVWEKRSVRHFSKQSRSQKSPSQSFQGTMLLVNGAYVSLPKWWSAIIVWNKRFYLFFTTWSHTMYDIKRGVTRRPFANTKMISIKRLFRDGKRLWEWLDSWRDGNWRKKLMGNSLFFSFSFLLLLSAKSHLFLKYDSICHNLFQTQILKKKKQKKNNSLHCCSCGIYYNSNFCVFYK